jgi:hypothetical protein
MNKKLLFGIMSLAALASCSTDDFENKTVAEGAASPVQFEVINGNDAITRASMNGNKIVWSATDGDIFTLFHTGLTQNATYKATATDGGAAILTTPSMIGVGTAVMVWPADTTFRTGAGTVSVVIPTELTNIENNIPYVSDEITIGAYAKWDDANAATQFNVAGKDRKYPVFMRPIASQLILKADYASTDATIAELYDGGAACPADGGIEPITLTSVELSSPTVAFNTDVNLKFSPANTGLFGPTSGSALGYEILDNWAAAAPNHNWTKVTELDLTGINATSTSLVTKCITGTESCKFLLLKQAAIAGANTDAAIIVKTLYGDVVIADPAIVGGMTEYTAAEIADAWYRYVTDPTAPSANIHGSEVVPAAAETSGDYAGKYKVTANTAVGLEQTIDAFSAYTATSGTAKYEPVGAAATRFVKVLLNHLDMNALHVKSDKHLRDAALVHEKMGLPTTFVQLDGDATNHEFEISQKTIKLINDFNAAEDAKNAADPGYIQKYFYVQACGVGAGDPDPSNDEYCEKIVITGASDIANVQDLTFIQPGYWPLDVVLKKGETWKWNTTGTVNVIPWAVQSIINNGTFVTDADARYKTAFAGTQYDVPFVNNGTWNISGATLYPEFSVTNNGTVNIASGAQYRQSGFGSTPTAFTNDATAKPKRFGGNDNKIGKVINKGVFATVTGGSINNYGLIEHAADDAKTYITTNQIGTGFAAKFANDNLTTVPDESNKIGQINLTYANRNEDNISISAGAGAQGFVSVTVTTADAPANKKLDVATVGTWVNYVIIKSGIEEIVTVSPQVEFIEFNSGNTEIAWNLPVLAPTATYTGLMVLSPVNIKLGTTISVTSSCYLGKDMYVGGEFDNGTPGTLPSWNGYFGNTASNVPTMYVTY